MRTTRRDVLRAAPAAALGITSVALPAAAAAASDGETPQEVTPELLVAWSFGATVTQFGAVTSASLNQTTTIDPTVTGTFAFSDLETTTSGQTKWFVDTQSATLDTGTAPYMEWSIATSGSDLDLRYLAVHGIAADGGSNYIASFRHSGDGYTTDLRTLTPVGAARNLLVDLSSLAVVTTSVTLRMFVHGNTSRQGLFTMNLTNTSPFQVGVDEFLAAQGASPQCVSILGNLVP